MTGTTSKKRTACAPGRAAGGRRRGFAGDARGVVAIIFGVVAMPMIALAGGAFDYSNAARTKTELQGVTDAAALAAGVAAREGKSEAEQRAAATAVFTAHCPGKVCGRGAAHETALGDTITVTATAQMGTAFLGLIGRNEFAIDSLASVRMGTATVEAYFVLDMSGSMNIPFEKDDITTFAAEYRPWGDSCAFACHFVTNGGTPLRDDRVGSEVAREMGIGLREDEVGKRTADIIDRMDETYGDSASVAVAAFGRTNASGWEYQRIFDLDNDLDDAKASLDTISSKSGGTYLEGVLKGTRDWLGESRSSATSTTQAVILLTDGMDDGGKVMKSKHCDVVKDAGAELFVMNIVYPDPATIGGTKKNSRNIAKIYDDLAPALKACASSPEHYFEASHGEDFDLGFKRLAERIGEMTDLALTK